ncbi:sporulation integral membrane protein YlbJ [Geobacillus stearothermophilus]|uniref:sporulation integral membrane protein YlbJ n=1 Tax=Geobacillus TaxID=129337 RepID=UPI0006DC7BCE|nr:MULTISPECIES: sporulation integral membrane protein YlbJ [Geobacillus]KQC47745.1 sporulation integral membrane protein YlbJ [Geobacillus sp. Sah69]MED3843646.1 sporulation integral membrane protein YlbJ [Geobacillus stearothermophilus]MED4355576.1 sporulation integral membrane protein YlbJ [Geobacillus stearothermophilus]
MKRNWGAKLKTALLASAVTLFAFSLICYPKQSLQASIRGLNMWWEVVFPSLLPFFIVSELLISFGVVSFLGVLLEPLMRPLFRVPGVGGFAWAMGMASGYPSGAKLTARLYQEKQLSTIEAERLSSFTNSSNPLFIFGAVSAGFFNNPQLGLLLAVSHYLGNIAVGLVMRFHGIRKERGQPKRRPRSFSFPYALRTLHKTRLKNEQPLGKLLGDAVHSSVQTLLMIGGFIILFSVVNQLLYMMHLTEQLAPLLRQLLRLVQLPEQLDIPIFSGLFEITLGSQMISQTDEAELLEKAVAVSFVLAFGGFSVQAQVASILAEANIRFQPFFIARFLHGVFAASFTYLLWEPLYLRAAGNETGNIPVFWHAAAESVWHERWQWLQHYGPLATMLFLCLYIWLAANASNKTRGRL